MGLGLHSFFFCMLLICVCAQAQVSAPASAPAQALTPGTAPVATVKAHGSAAANFLPWTALTPTQRDALAPLAETWSAFSETRKRKWIAIANSLPSLSESERAKLHERMEEWAKLSRQDREQARLNFAQSKTLAKSERAANWEAYQALSAEERQRLAAQAPVKPAGAAVAVKPAPSERLVSVPLTRHTPDSARAALAQQMQLDHKTLLPRNPPASGASAPAKP